MSEEKQVDHRQYAQRNLTQAVNQAQRVDGADDPEALGLLRATIASTHASLAIAEGLDRLALPRAAGHEFDLPKNPWWGVAATLLADESIEELTKQIVEGSNGYITKLPYKVVKDALTDVIRQHAGEHWEDVDDE